MSSFVWPDLSCLMSLARDQDVDVRPVLLRVHTDIFIAAPSRDRDTIAAFEALALGFLPIVDDETATIVAKKLAPISDTPPKVVDALVRRGGETREAILSVRGQAAPQSEAGLPGRPLPSLAADSQDPEGDGLRMRPGGDEVDLARDPHASLDRLQLQKLVALARRRPELASTLLKRQDLSPSDEASLYLHADAARRVQIRSRLERAIALASRGPFIPRADQSSISTLLNLARSRNTEAFGAQLARMLGLAPMMSWDFHLEPQRDLLALALVAAGVAEEDCIRIFLTLDPHTARSVGAVFHLAQIARQVPRAVAVHLIEAILGVTIGMRREGRHVRATDPSGVPVRGIAASSMPPKKGVAEHGSHRPSA